MPINSNSDVVGDSVLQSDLGPSAIPVHAAIFPHDGGIIDLGTFGGPRSSTGGNQFEGAGRRQGKP